MRAIEAVTDTPASPEAAWAVLTDFPRIRPGPPTFSGSKGARRQGRGFGSLRDHPGADRTTYGRASSKPRRGPG
jgi:hypothetical protein